MTGLRWRRPRAARLGHVGVYVRVVREGPVVRPKPRFRSPVRPVRVTSGCGTVETTIHRAWAQHVQLSLLKNKADEFLRDEADRREV